MHTKMTVNLGIAGVALLLASWGAVGLAGRIVAPPVVPHIWMAVVVAGLPIALLLGVTAGSRGSRLWLLVSVLSLLSEAFCLLSAAV